MLEDRPQIADWKSLLGLLAQFKADQREFLLHHDGYRSYASSCHSVWLAAHAGAAVLRQAGVNAGDNVLIWSENRPEWVFAFWACLLTEAVVVPLDSRSSAAFVERIVKQVQPRLVLLGEDVPTVPGSSLRLTAIDWTAPSEHTPLPAGDPGSTVEIVFTSGSTGEPKGVVITHSNLLANIVAMDRELVRYGRFVRLLAPVRLVNLLPFSHLFGQQFGLFLPALVHASSVLVHSFSPPAIAGLIRRHKASALVATPRMLELMEAYVRERFKVRDEPGHWTLRWVRHLPVHLHFGWRFCLLVAGAAALDIERQRFWRSMSFVVTQGYGLTETSPIVSFDDPLAAKAGTVGRPLPGVEIRIAEDGEILLRGPSVFSGYYKAPEKTAAVFDAEGWFQTGDIGSIGPDGRLTVRGRKKDIIVAGSGEKIFPEDVEHVLSRIAGVRDAAVIGPDRVHAILILEPGASPEGVVRDANAILEPHQKVTKWSLWPGSEFPRTEATRKLKRNEIAKGMESGVAPQPVRAAVQSVLERLRGESKTTTLEEAGLTSLDRVELAMELEEHGGDEAPWTGEATLAEVFAQETRARESQAFPRWNRSLWARAIRFLTLNLLVFPFVRLAAWRRLEGGEELEHAKGPLLLASNHQSHLDVPLILRSP